MQRWLLAKRGITGSGGSAPEDTPLAVRVHAGVVAEVRRIAEADYTTLGDELRRAGHEVDDYGDRALTPAFVNAHTHLALVFLRGADPGGPNNLVEDFYFQQESKLSADDVRAFTRLGAYESLLSGVGCVWDHYYHAAAVAEALEEVGLCGVVAPTLQDLAGPGAGDWRAALDLTERLATDGRWARAGIFAALGPHATDTVSDALMGEALRLAVEQDLPLHMHLAQSAEEVQRVRARTGFSPTAWLDALRVLEHGPRVVLAHGLYLDRSQLSMLDPERHALVFCPHSQMQFGFTADIQLWSEQGVRWVVATDCASSNDSMQLQKELRTTAGMGSCTLAASEELRGYQQSPSDARAAQVHAERQARVAALAPHVAPRALLDRVWGNAGSLHPGFKVGVIEAGALANMVVWDTAHPNLWPATDLWRGLAMADSGAAIHAMFVRGERVGRDGDFARSLHESPSYAAARLEADQRLSRLAG